MPSSLLHASAVERLAEVGAALPSALMRALSEDLEYARFGALLLDLPWFEGLRGTFLGAAPDGVVPHFARLFHERAPVAMGLKLAELVDSGALVGRDAGLAVVSGYFAHLCLDRALHPLVDRLAGRHRLRGESEVAAHRRIEWTQALFYLREMHGRDVVGTSHIRSKFQLSKSRLPTHGIGRGLYELIRLAAQETLHEAPTKDAVDGWVRGAFLHGVVLSTPIGRARAVPYLSPLSRRELFVGDDVDFPREVDRALGQARKLLTRVYRLVERGTFSPRSRERFFADFPEGAVATYAA